MSKILVVFVVLLGIVQHGNAVLKCAYTDGEILDTSEEPYLQYDYKDKGGAESVFDNTALRCLNECFRSTAEVNYAEFEADIHSLLDADYYCRCFKNIPGSANFKKVQHGVSMQCWESNI